MKKVLFAALLLVSSHSMFAQINQGQWLVGGTAGFNYSKQGDADAGKNTSIWVAPDAGYFFMDKLAAGLNVNFSSNKNKAASDANTTIAVAPFVRYYFLDAAQKVNVFADAHYGFGSMKSGGNSESINEWQIKAGPAVFLTPNTALEFALYYRSFGGEGYENAAGDRDNNFGLSIGFQIHLGNGGGSSKK